MLQLIREAINKDKLSSKISGIFEGSSALMNYVGLIPVAGTVAGLAGIASDLASRGIDKANVKNKWYELASQIQRTRSMEKIHRALNNLGSL